MAAFALTETWARAVPGDRRVVVVSDNLLDRARIEEASRSAGWEPQSWARNEPPPELALVDLESQQAEAAIAALVTAATRVVAFGPHVDTDALAGAKSLGAEALPRSQFFGRLPEFFFF